MSFWSEEEAMRVMSTYAERLGRTPAIPDRDVQFATWDVDPVKKPGAFLACTPRKDGGFIFLLTDYE